MSLSFCSVVDLSGACHHAVVRISAEVGTTPRAWRSSLRVLWPRGEQVEVSWTHAARRVPELQQAGRGLMRRDRGWGNTSDYRVRLAVSTRPLRASTSPRKSPSKSVARTSPKTSARGLMAGSNQSQSPTRSRPMKRTRFSIAACSTPVDARMTRRVFAPDG